MVTTLKNCYTVKPAEPTPLVKLWLPEVDQVQALYALTVYFYPARNPSPEGDAADSNEQQPSPVRVMVDSLSQALVHFYPLAGRFHQIDEGGQLEVDCNSMGALIFEAESESESTLQDFGDFAPSPKMRDELVPQVDYKKPIHENPLLLVQFTRLKCGGVCVGIANSRIMSDGLSAMHFISCWAQLSRGQPLKPDQVPFLDRTILRMPDTFTGPRFRHTEYEHPPLLVGAQDDMEERKKETSVAMLKLSTEQMEKLKQKANADRTEGDGRGRWYSRYEALAGHMWASSSKARGHVDEQLTSVQIAVDCRNRIRPPLPPRYFGNFVFFSTPVAQAGDLMSKPLSYAASKMREGAEIYTDEYIRSSIDYLKQKKPGDASKYRTRFQTAGCVQQGDFLGNPNFVITSWLGLPIYDADFGWGKPAYMGPANLGFDGKSFVIPAGDEDGSLAIAIRMQKAHIDDFKRFFHQDI